MQKNKNRLKIIEIDPWLKPNEAELEYRHELYVERLDKLSGGSGNLADFANAHRYYGFQRDDARNGWWFREWLPGAYEVFLIGDFNDWNRHQLPLYKDNRGVWSIFLADIEWGDKIVHGVRYKMIVKGQNGTHERLSAYVRRAVQDDETKNFSGQLWLPEHPFDWSGDMFDFSTLDSLLIYEAHVGMAQEEPRVGTYTEFTENILPRIASAGYNAIQLMAIAEHPYYGSFGYHVSNFFAPSSRFGTPEELKTLIKTAHEMGLAVIMDLVHSHYVKNLNEGLNELDGTKGHYSPMGDAGYQKYWDSKNFNYTKDEVTHFLLSNIKYWLEEFHFDGFRFDGVTSMIFHHHGYTEFDAREKYFDETVNRSALTYLTLVNKLMHEVYPSSVSIAEDVSGMPGMCISIEDGGVGFDYRLGMAIPDFWIEMLKDQRDEDWSIWEIWNIMITRLPTVKTIAYAESHDQALVGDKTIAFRLMDKEMYYNMASDRNSLVVDRGMSLHKMIRLATITLGGQAYLNFMGNEFGHPEWIDFPREGNGWSYEHARRQWSLAEDQNLKYRYLADFDRDMLSFIKRYSILSYSYPNNLMMDEINKTMVYNHGDLVFVLNWHPSASTPGYEFPIYEPGKYEIVMSSDDKKYAGQGRHDNSVEHFSYSIEDENGKTRHKLKVYNVSRTALILRKID